VFLFFQLGSYILPFVVMGTFLMLDAIFIYFTLPPLGNEPGQLRPEGKFLLLLVLIWRMTILQNQNKSTVKSRSSGL
jgi:hypothetical protein